MATAAASKAGLIGLTQVLAAEYGAKDVRVNALPSGGTDTPATEKAMTPIQQLPSIAQALGPLLRRIPVEQQPVLIAFLERSAAQRYRVWADHATQSDRKASLLACAEREEEIARRIEGLYPEAESMQRELLAANPELADLGRSLFAPYSLEEQFAIQAQGERAGAATWRSFAARAGTPQARDVFLSCAVLEEESADFLESIAGAQG